MWNMSNNVSVFVDMAFNTQPMQVVYLMVVWIVINMVTLKRPSPSTIVTLGMLSYYSHFQFLGIFTSFPQLLFINRIKGFAKTHVRYLSDPLSFNPVRVKLVLFIQSIVNLSNPFGMIRIPSLYTEFGIFFFAVCTRFLGTSCGGVFFRTHHANLSFIHT